MVVNIGILDDFIKNIRGQRARYKAEQKRAAEEKSREAKQPPKEPSKYGYVGEVARRMKEQREKFEAEQRGGREAAKGPAQAVQVPKAPETVTQFGHTFKRMPDTPPHVWLDDAAKAAYIDDTDAFVKSGGKVEQRGITAAMDPYMYDIYTGRGGPVGQARYYRQENVVVSLVPDPFPK